MKKEKLEELLTHLELIDLGDYFLYDTSQIYDKKTEETQSFDSIEDLLAYKNINKKLDEIQFNILGGGRGASSIEKNFNAKEFSKKALVGG